MLKATDIELLLVKVHNEHERQEVLRRVNESRYIERYGSDYVYEPELWEDGEVDSWYDIEEIFGGKDVSFTIDGIKVEAVEFDTGGEGHGEDIYMVFKTTDADGVVQLWRKDGYYASYDGDNWDGDFRKVDAVERVVVFYE